MKKLLIVAMIAFAPCSLMAQADYKVVFDLTTKDSMAHKALMRWIGEIIKAEPRAQIEVVMFAQGVSMVAQGKSTVAADISRLAANKNIRFNVCEVAMQNQNLVRSQLLPEILLVPDGIYEIISKQRQGWGYIKAGL